MRVAGSSWHSVRGQALREAIDVAQTSTRLNLAQRLDWQSLPIGVNSDRAPGLLCMADTGSGS